jgi:hypothetical protein
MPRGKASIGGALIRRPQLEALDLFPTLLAEAHLKRTAPTATSLASAQTVLCDAVEVFIGSHRGTVLVTATVREKVKAEIGRCALRLARSPNEVSLRRHLLQAIASLDLGGRDALHKHLTAHGRRVGRRAGIAWLERWLRSTLPVPPVDVTAIQAVAEFAAVRVIASWRDPFLPRLVRVASPVWTDLTGRTPLAQDGEKNFLFAQWLWRIVDEASDGEVEARPSTVVDILRR